MVQAEVVVCGESTGRRGDMPWGDMDKASLKKRSLIAIRSQIYKRKKVGNEKG